LYGERSFGLLSTMRADFHKIWYEDRSTFPSFIIKNFMLIFKLDGLKVLQGLKFITNKSSHEFKNFDPNLIF